MEIIETNLEFGSMTERKSTNRIILHHSGVSVLQSVEVIHSYHKNTNGWAGIGYHFYVRKTGEIYRGRPEKYIGAHAYGANSDSIGICAEGDFNTETMNNTQKNAIKELVLYLKQKYNVSLVQKHSDTIATSCPGSNYPFDEIVNGQIEEKQDEQPIQNAEDKNTDIFSDGKINCIYDIQEWLNRHYNAGLALDNIYGPKTKQALIKGLQTELNKQYGKGLVIDGIFGPNTYNACITVRQGAEGNITMLIQMALFIKGYNLSMNKIFGADTTVKVKAFQSKNALAVDGIVGKNTFEKLFK